MKLVFSKNGYDYFARYDADSEAFEIFLGGDDCYIGDCDTLNDAKAFAIDHYNDRNN